MGNACSADADAASSLPNLLWTLAGLSPGRQLWGTRPIDMGLWCCFSWVKKEPWYAELPAGHGHGHGHGGGHGHSERMTTTEHKKSWLEKYSIHRVPSMRHLWGEKQDEVHAGGQELFLDLIFVGVAFRVGECMKKCIKSCTPADEANSYTASSYTANSSYTASSYTSSYSYICLPFSTALLHSLAPFVCMYTLWEIEKRYRAAFEAGSSAVHSAFDLLNDLLLILAAMNVQPATAYRSYREPDKGLARVLVPILLALGLWLVRVLEIALLSPREAARRQSSAEVVLLLQLCAIWGAAFLLSTASFDEFNDEMSDLAAGLVWIGALPRLTHCPPPRGDRCPLPTDGVALCALLGALWWIVRPAIRTWAEIKFPKQSLPMERSAVCGNAGFMLHRNNGKLPTTRLHPPPLPAHRPAHPRPDPRLPPSQSPSPPPRSAPSSSALRLMRRVCAFMRVCTRVCVQSSCS
jgi:hypothetical protein